ncbi:MAG TPA: hypothetical protein VKB41_17060 [Steroidobacteraceae bacterium]|nr:hypothetical protein [Steroidobacteraceae bacterium]
MGKKNYEFHCEGHTVRLLGEGPFRRWFCDCAEYAAPMTRSGYAFCRHTQIISSQLSGHPFLPGAPKHTATILKFSPRIRALAGRRH